MGRTLLTGWFFLLLSLAASAQLPMGPVVIAGQHGRHLAGHSSTADVAETPDEHIQERRDGVPQRH
ncbi:hypothetical protein F3J42_02360 [Pantoea sp. Ap-959]|uniref:hypothetical protein n=1 Tax=unclassified Pantoea TaxID=2630326 RepID=UPI0011B09B9D|nr:MULTISPECIES: hypothetical protein [unclassified Pantoea]NIG32744.1 hypothetical protein [Pantoea sp. Ap-959]